MKWPIKETAIAIGGVLAYALGIYLIFGLWYPAAANFDELNNAGTITIPTLIGVAWCLGGGCANIFAAICACEAWGDYKRASAREKHKQAERAKLTPAQLAITQLIDRIEALEWNDPQRPLLLERAKRLYPVEPEPKNVEADLIAIELDMFELAHRPDTDIKAQD